MQAKDTNVGGGDCLGGGCDEGGGAWGTTRRSACKHGRTPHVTAQRLAHSMLSLNLPPTSQRIRPWKINTILLLAFSYSQFSASVRSILWFLKLVGGSAGPAVARVVRRVRAVAASGLGRNF